MRFGKAAHTYSPLQAPTSGWKTWKRLLFVQLSPRGRRREPGRPTFLASRLRGLAPSTRHVRAAVAHSATSSHASDTAAVSVLQRGPRWPQQQRPPPHRPPPCRRAGDHDVRPSYLNRNPQRPLSPNTTLTLAPTGPAAPLSLRTASGNGAVCTASSHAGEAGGTRTAAYTGVQVPAVAAAAATRPAVSFSRRRVVTLASTLLMALLPPPTPFLELSVQPQRPAPPSGAGQAGAAPAAGTEELARGTAEDPRRAAAAAGEAAGQEVFCYVAPEPLEEAGPAAPPSPLHFASLAAAVATCPEGGVVLVAAGRYRERLLLSRPLTVRAWPEGARVELVWETSEPYQSTLEISGRGSGPGMVVQGLTVRHSSKSVANNYGVFIRGGSPVLRDCDISSATGAGVGVDGANPQLVGCRIHDCARQGVAIFGGGSLELDLDPAIDPGMMYGMAGGVVRECDVYGNALDGVLVRSGASPDLLDNLIHNNAGFGVNLQDCSGRYERNTVYDNSRGSVAVSALFELDPGDLAGANSLRGLMRRL